MDPNTNDKSKASFQFSMFEIFVWVLLAALLIAGCINAGPEPFALLWVPLLVYLVYHAYRQCWSLYRGENLPFSEVTSSRWIWFSCRALGGGLVAIALVDPFEMAPLAYSWFSSIQPADGELSLDRHQIKSTLIREMTPRMFLPTGLLLCLIPLWQFGCQKRRYRHACLWFSSIVGLLLLLDAGNQSQLMNIIIYVACEGIEMGMLNPNIEFEEFFTSDLGSAKHRLYDHCEKLFVIAVGMFASLLFFIRKTGATRLFSAIAWICCCGYLSFQFGQMYFRSDGQTVVGQLNPAWKETLGIPHDTGLFCMLISILLMGFIANISLGKSRLSQIKIDQQKLSQFCIGPFASVYFVGLLCASVFFGNFGNIDGLLLCFWSGAGFAWITILVLFGLRPLILRRWNRNQIARGPVDCFPSLGIMQLNWLMFSVSIFFLALSTGWYGFAGGLVPDKMGPLKLLKDLEFVILEFHTFASSAIIFLLTAIPVFAFKMWLFLKFTLSAIFLLTAIPVSAFKMWSYLSRRLNSSSNTSLNANSSLTKGKLPRLTRTVLYSAIGCVLGFLFAAYIVLCNVLVCWLFYLATGLNIGIVIDNLFGFNTFGFTVFAIVMVAFPLFVIVGTVKGMRHARTVNNAIVNLCDSEPDVHTLD